MSFMVEMPGEKRDPRYQVHHETMEAAVFAAQQSAWATESNRSIVDEQGAVLAEVRWVPGHTEVVPVLAQTWVVARRSYTDAAKSCYWSTCGAIEDIQHALRYPTIQAAQVECDLSQLSALGWAQKLVA
jgi:hypothetical protein